MEQVFPGLRGSRYEEKSPSTVNYNCIAWAAGETHRCWWPIDHPRYYWPIHISKEESIPCFLRTFQEEFGYEVCPDGQLQRGYEKVALFVDAQQIPTHMARQLPTGVWTSKLGDFQDIEHHTLEALEGNTYGTVARYMRRRMPDAKPALRKRIAKLLARIKS